MKKFQKFLVFFICAQIGVCLGHIFAVYNNFVRHPALYAMYSAPWYVDVIPTVVITTVLIIITTIIYFIVGRIIKKRELEKKADEQIE